MAGPPPHLAWAPGGPVCEHVAPVRAKERGVVAVEEWICGVRSDVWYVIFSVWSLE